LAFDAAFKTALDFAKSRKDTLIVVVADHGTGGINLGNLSTRKNYTEKGFRDFMNPLFQAKLTGEGLEQKLNEDRSNIQEVLRNYWGIADLGTTENETIKNAPKGKLNSVVGPMMSERAFVGWTSYGGHSGEEVALYLYAPSGFKKLSGVVENTQVSKYVEKALHLNLKQVSERLYISASDLKDHGIQVQEDFSVTANPILYLSVAAKKLQMPVNKNYGLLNGKKVLFPGVTVYTGRQWFVSQAVIDRLKK
jgi:alkaline phosphatase